MNTSITKGNTSRWLRWRRLLLATIIVVSTLAGTSAHCVSQDRSFPGDFHIAAWAAGGPSPYHTVHSGLEYGEALDIYTAGVDAGWLAKKNHGPGVLRGRGEVLVELVPFWLAHLPEQTVTVHQPNGFELTPKLPSYYWHGVSAAPLLRWNFGRAHRHLSPFGELGGGLLWTSQKFPQGKGVTYTTSRINFTPQAGFGVNIFTRPHQSMQAGLSVVHTSSAGLGDYNPGVNINLQFRLGYSWWR